MVRSSYQPVQQPRQERSRATMTQILDAAAQILETKSFDELTVAEVVEAAGTSVGAFYGRFRDKDGLLQALDERFFDEFEARFHALLATPGWGEQPLARLVQDAVAFIVTTYSHDQGVLRSLNLKGRLHGDSRFRQREQRAWNELFPRLQAILLARRAEITHPNPDLATRLGFQQMFFAARELLLWEPVRAGQSYPADELTRELTQAFLAYLGAAEG